MPPNYKPANELTSSEIADAQEFLDLFRQAGVAVRRVSPTVDGNNTGAGNYLVATLVIEVKVEIGWEAASHTANSWMIYRMAQDALSTLARYPSDSDRVSICARVVGAYRQLLGT